MIKNLLLFPDFEMILHVYEGHFDILKIVNVVDKYVARLSPSLWNDRVVLVEVNHSIREVHYEHQES